jgi:transcriptional regulator with XRE-family HTH domain
MPEIGETLRDARMRARIDVSEIEAKTKIRAKYLRALENEEWGLLPGPTFVKSFLRTYAQALGLDGKALVEEYRLSHEGLTEAALEPIVSSPQSSRSPGAGRAPRGPSRGYMVVVGVVGPHHPARCGTAHGGRGQLPEAHRKQRLGITRSQEDRPSRLRPGLHSRHPAVDDGDPLAEALRRCVRMPDRRQRAQADPRQRTAAGREHPHLSRQTL